LYSLEGGAIWLLADLKAKKAIRTQETFPRFVVGYRPVNVDQSIFGGSKLGFMCLNPASSLGTLKRIAIHVPMLYPMAT